MLPADIGLEALDKAFWDAQRISGYKKKKTKSRVSTFKHRNNNNNISVSSVSTGQVKFQRRQLSNDATHQRFSSEPWSVKVRLLFVRFMSSVKDVLAQHIEFVLQFLFDLIQQSRLSEVLLVLRCVRQSSWYNKECSSWRLPFYVLLETTQEAIRQGWSNSIITVPLCTRSFVPKLEEEQKKMALAKYIHLNT
jgi:hypothetical protein